MARQVLAGCRTPVKFLGAGNGSAHGIDLPNDYSRLVLFANQILDGSGQPGFLKDMPPRDAPGGAASRGATVSRGPAVGRRDTAGLGLRARRPGARGPTARFHRHCRALLMLHLGQVHTLPGLVPAGVVLRVPRSTIAFRERVPAEVRACPGRGSPGVNPRNRDM